MSSVPEIETKRLIPENRFPHSDTDLLLLCDVEEGPDDVFEAEPSDQSYFRVDVPSRYDYYKREKSLWESSQSYFWEIIEYIWPNKN